MARRIESLMLAGPAGALEALLEEPEETPARALALVCHPHPLFGGTMHNKVVYRLARGLRRSGAAVLRFNFRGVGTSQGEHDHGAGEADDARIALDWLRARFPGLPYVLAGFSFGSRIILGLGCTTGGASLLIAAGFPAAHGDPAFLESCQSPKIFIQSTRDEFAPVPQMEALFERIAEPKQLVWIDAQDHFFQGGLDQLEETVFGLKTTV
ncbi:MAG: alpha/beta hydrolase [Candidatus Solibacter usitatus]|nr:alpha/beta hydrolase [Candidatus Solibacter usitatus]